LLDDAGQVIRIFKNPLRAHTYEGNGTVTLMSRKDAVAAIRKQVFSLSGGQCKYCGRPIDWNFHMHEVIPRSQGGEISLENSIALCAKCHMQHPAAHGDRSLQFGDNKKGINNG
jgi:hypothetical protein